MNSCDFSIPNCHDKVEGNYDSIYGMDRGSERGKPTQMKRWLKFLMLDHLIFNIVKYVSNTDSGCAPAVICFPAGLLQQIEPLQTLSCRCSINYAITGTWMLIGCVLFPCQPSHPDMSRRSHVTVFKCQTDCRAASVVKNSNLVTDLNFTSLGFAVNSLSKTPIWNKVKQLKKKGLGVSTASSFSAISIKTQ